MKNENAGLKASNDNHIYINEKLSKALQKALSKNKGKNANNESTEKSMEGSISKNGKKQPNIFKKENKKGAQAEENKLNLSGEIGIHLDELQKNYEEKRTQILPEEIELRGQPG